MNTSSSGGVIGHSTGATTLPSGGTYVVMGYEDSGYTPWNASISTTYTGGTLINLSKFNLSYLGRVLYFKIS